MCLLDNLFILLKRLNALGNAIPLQPLCVHQFSPLLHKFDPGWSARCTLMPGLHVWESIEHILSLHL